MGVPTMDLGMDAVWQGLANIRRMRKRMVVMQVLNLALIVFSALMIWKGLMFWTKAEGPVVVVLSGSMEPAFYRGDILFLHRGDEPFGAGEVCVFKITGRDIPIVHRIMKVHDSPDKNGYKKQELLTKGDNNNLDDRGLYN